MRVLYFAWVREAVGPDTETVDTPAATVAELLDWLADRSAGHAAALADRARIRVAVDQRVAGPDTSVEDAVEVAIFPPVTGG